MSKINDFSCSTASYILLLCSIVMEVQKKLEMKEKVHHKKPQQWDDTASIKVRGSNIILDLTEQDSKSEKGGDLEAEESDNQESEEEEIGVCDEEEDSVQRADEVTEVGGDTEHDENVEELESDNMEETSDKSAQIRLENGEAATEARGSEEKVESKVHDLPVQREYRVEGEESRVKEETEQGD